MEVTLTVLERLVLLSLLPKEGSFLTLKLLRKFREALSFDELELRKLSFVQDGDQVRWDTQTGNKVRKTLKIGDTLVKMITDILKDLDRKEKLTEDQVSLYTKFVGDPEDKPSLEVVSPKGKSSK